MLEELDHQQHQLKTTNNQQSSSAKGKEFDRFSVVYVHNE